MSLQAFGQGGHDSLALLQSKVFERGIKENGSLNLAEFLKSKGIAIVNRGTILDIPENLGVGFEKRATFDIIFNIANNFETDIGDIEQVTVKGKVVLPDASEIIVDPIIVNKP